MSSPSTRSSCDTRLLAWIPGTLRERHMALHPTRSPLPHRHPPPSPNFHHVLLLLLGLMPSRYRTLLRERHRLIVTLHAIQSSMTFFSSSSSAACRVGIRRGITIRWLQRDISGNLDRLKLPCLVPLDLLLRRQPHSKVQSRHAQTKLSRALLIRSPRQSAIHKQHLLLPQSFLWRWLPHMTCR